MDLLDILNHLLNFLAPAFFMAVLLVPGGACLLRGRSVGLARWRQGLMDFTVGALVLVVGLWWWERDGKMATYVALVLACTTSHWLGQRAWRR